MLEAGSLRGQLQRYLLSGFVAVWAASASAIHYAAERFVTVGYDHSLFDTALDLTAQIHDRDGHLTLEITPALQGVLAQDGKDRVFYAVKTDAGVLLGGTAGLPTPPRLPDPGHGVHYYDAVYQAEPLRMAMARMPVGGAGHRQVQVQVGETLHGRNGLGAHVQWSIAALQLVQLLLIIFLVRHAVERGLQPLKHLTSAVAGRGPADTDELPVVGLVSEVRPLVASMNALLGRLRDVLIAQRQFIADASHQLRTPLAGIQLQLDLALAQTDPIRQRLALEQAHAATIRAARLSHQLLMLSRAEPQALGEQTVCDIARLADDVAAQFAAQAFAGRVILDVDVSPESAPVRGDPVLLRELIGNLLDNAIRYAGRDARVSVRVAARDARVALDVADDGPGIAADLRSKVFSRFYRIPGTPGAGCGLGLAIVAEIAGRHGAGVSLREGPGGRGTAVRVDFPAATRSGSEEPRDEPPAVPRDAGASRGCAGNR